MRAMNLRNFRESRGLTQQQAADELGVRSKSHISMMERGVSRPSIRLALQIEAWSDGEVRAVEILDRADVELLRRANLDPVIHPAAPRDATRAA